MVHFTEIVPRAAWNPAESEAGKSDWSLVMGTSMNVQPAAMLPLKALSNENGKAFIVNLQRTPYDDVVTNKIYSKTDEFMHLLMQELNIDEFDLSYDHLTVLTFEKEQYTEFVKAVSTAVWGVITLGALAFALYMMKNK